MNLRTPTMRQLEKLGSIDSWQLLDAIRRELEETEARGQSESRAPVRRALRRLDKRQGEWLAK